MKILLLIVLIGFATSNKYIVAANFTKLTYKGEDIILKNNIINSFFGIIDDNGTLIDVKTYTMPYSYYLTHAVKLNSETINLLGVKTAENDMYRVKNDPKIKLFYLLLDTDGNIEYKY